MAMQRRVLAVTVCLTLFLSALAVSGERAEPSRPQRRGADSAIGRDFKDGRITRAEAALYRVQSVFKPELLPERYARLGRGIPQGSGRCLTPVLAAIYRDWDVLSEEGRSLVPKHMRPARRSEKMFIRKGTVPEGVVIEGSGEASADSSATLDKTDGGDIGDPPTYDRTYATTNFLIHWSTSGEHRLIQSADSNGNGIPDMVESTGTVLEATWTWMSSRGYRMPLGTETHYLNIYFENLGYGYFGYTSIVDWPSSYSRAFISLNCDFSGYYLPSGATLTPIQSMRTTASHEFMHACQFAYDAMEDAWWMEATAMWIMDLVGPEWDAVNDYLWNVIDFLQYPDVALDAWWDPAQWYADVMWTMFLDNHVDTDGNGSIMREIWQACEGSRSALEANELVLDSYLPGGFTEAFQDFLVANYKADYPEAPQFPAEYGDLYYSFQLYTYPTGMLSPYFTPNGLGSNYVRFFRTGSAGYDLVAQFTGYASPSWVGMLVGKKSGGYTRVDGASGTPISLIDFTTDCTEAALIVSPVVGNSDWTDVFYWEFSASLQYGDAIPPTPSPMTFASAPHATSTTSIAMTATTATDAKNPPVEYQFEETQNAPGGTDTDWVSGTSYTDTGLSVNTRYGYRVRARDSAPTPNVGSWSNTVLVYTLCNTPAAPVLHDESPTKLYITLGSDGNPSSTTCAVYNVTSGNYISSAGTPSGAAYWATRSQWNSIRIIGLSPSTTYSFVVKARNGDSVETGFSPVGQGTTLAADTTPPAASNVAIVPTWVKESITTSVTATATGSDLSRGSSDIVAAEYYLGSDPGQGNGTAMQPADGAFNSPYEAVVVTINTSGWTMASSPRHLYVRVRDEAGFWSTPAHLAIQIVDGIPPATVTDLSAVPAAPGLEDTVTLTLDEASSQMGGHEAVKAVDGNVLTPWATAAEAEPSSEYIILDTDSDSYLSKITLHTSDRADLFPAYFKVKLLDDGQWYTVVTQRDYLATPGANTWQFGARKAQQLKIEIVETPQDGGSTLYWAELGEIVVLTDAGGSRAVELAWTAPSDVGPTGRAAMYQVKYSDNSSSLSPSWSGTEPGDTPPVPAAPGTPEAMHVTGLEPGSTLYFAVRSVDDYSNWSQVSNVTVTVTLPDPNPYVALDSPEDDCCLEIETPTSFAWHANIYDLFRVQFSNTPEFPSRPYRDTLGRMAKTLSYGVRRGLNSFQPSVGQWKAIKRLASDMDGTLYWRVEARALRDRALGVAHSEVYTEYGFNTGTFQNMQLGPFHDREGDVSVWPNNRPQFAWQVTNPLYGTFYIDFAATENININDRRNTYSVRSPNRDRTWWRPTPGQWKQIKKRFANVNDGRIYWRVRGLDNDKAFTAVSGVNLLVIDRPVFQLRDPAPRRDGTVHPAEKFTLEWGVSGEGYIYFQPQVSPDPTFPRGRDTINLRRARNALDCELSVAQVKRLAKILSDKGTDVFYWRVIAIDVDNTMSAESQPASVTMSEEPAGGA